ncbi:MAG: hypothetical protein V1745_03210 [Patescibacteria group bacterium]
MKKRQSRRARKDARRRSLRAKARDTSRFLPAPVPEAAPEPLPSFEDLLEGALALDEQVLAPPPPPSHVRAVSTRRPLVRHGLTPSFAIAAELDIQHAFDEAILQQCLVGRLGATSVEALRFCRDFGSFIRRRVGSWTRSSKHGVRSVGGHRLWDSNGFPTEIGEEVWNLFRLRIRRQGAIEAIVARAFGRTQRRAA